MSLSLAKAAVRHLYESKNLSEAVAIASGKIPAPRRLAEDANPDKSGTQTWVLPDEDAVNKAILYCKNKLDAEVSVEPWDNGSQGGYAVTIKGGDYSDSDVQSIMGILRGFPASGAHQPGSTEKS